MAPRIQFLIRLQGVQGTNLLLLDLFMDTVLTEEVMSFRLKIKHRLQKKKIRKLSEESDVAYWK
jgi:transcription initiation factor IIE alpha subunit